MRASRGRDETAVVRRAAIGLVGVAAMLAGAGPLTGCKPYRIEYHKRPAYYKRAADGELPDRVVLDDGTIIVYEEIGSKGGPALGNAGSTTDTFKVREELEDGSVVLRALLPEHVVGNALVCLKNQEYELLWDQMISERTKMAYEAKGQGVEEFAAFFQKHRTELGKTLNRMLMGLATGETVVEPMGDGTIRCRFWPQVAQQFKFKHVTLAREEFGLRLVLIH
jgi:hypothetical protein